jgi:NADH-quinone oxidoreductase subunit M
MAAATFALIGFIYEQAHVRGVLDFGGLAKQIPFVGVCFVLVSLASLGLPGFVNFASELMVFIGSWSKYPWAVGAAVFGILITAIYLLRAVQSVCYGPVNPKWKSLKDAATLYEKFPFILLIGALLVFGFYPQGLLNLVRPAVTALLSGVIL